MTDAVQPDKLPLQGIRGWLALLAMGVLFRPLFTLIDLGRAADALVDLWYTDNGKPVVLGELAIALLLLGLEVVTAVAMFTRMKRFPALFTWLWIASVALPLGDRLLVMSYLPQLIDIDDDLARSVATFIMMGLWVWYLHASVRVKNTFTN